MQLRAFIDGYNGMAGGAIKRKLGGPSANIITKGLKKLTLIILIL
tara:strand:- start:1378 stop:1512 length:135 start_codon:yes stop_codon:yes gene_type:complete